MFIYDEIIKSLNSLLDTYSKENLPVDLNQEFIENKNQIIFKKDKSFELGGGIKPGFAINLISTDSFADEIILIGKDTTSILEDTSYVRVAIFSCQEDDLKKGNVYQNIRKIDYMKYQFALDGVMLRESAINGKESLLFSKKKTSLSLIGSYLIKKYKKLPIVKAVKMIFINQDDFPYDKLKNIKDREEDVTKALDHLVNKVKMDCDICKLQPVCNEVSKLVENDFKE